MSTLPPGPRLPALLQSMNFFRQPLVFFDECARRYGHCFTLRLLGFPGPIVMVSDPEVIQEVFTTDAKQFEAGEILAPLKPLLGEHSLLILDSAKHRSHRRLLMPPLHGERLQSYGEAIRALAEQTITTWPVGSPFALRPRLGDITLSVILHVVFGSTEDKAVVPPELLKQFLTLGANSWLMAPWMQIDLGSLTPWGRFVGLRREMYRMFLAEIAKRRALPEGTRDDMLSMLVEARDENGQPLSDSELRDELLTLIVAGNDTTASALAWALYEILQRPEIIERIRAEGTSQDVLALRPTSGASYLDATVKEALRFHPIFTFVLRRLTEPMQLAGYDLPSGTLIGPCIYLTHRRPDLWPEPERFLPERFMGKQPSPYQFFPFGGGIRYCIGASFAPYEMKIILAHILSRCDLSVTPGYTPRTAWVANVVVPSGDVPVVLQGYRNEGGEVAHIRTEKHAG